jgi:hypothetical protein
MVPDIRGLPVEGAIDRSRGLGCLMKCSSSGHPGRVGGVEQTNEICSNQVTGEAKTRA